MYWVKQEKTMRRPKLSRSGLPSSFVQEKEVAKRSYNKEAIYEVKSTKYCQYCQRAIRGRLNIFSPSIYNVGERHTKVSPYIDRP